jgi:hypothetical protein
MFTPGFDLLLANELRHKELMKEASDYRMLKEARMVGLTNLPGVAKVLASLGKGMVRMGVRLEQRYGGQRMGTTDSQRIKANG